MDKWASWPSRRLQITVVLVLVAGALLAIFVPPLSREGKARQLYTDSWFLDTDGMSMADPNSDSRRQSVRMLEKALELSPGNSHYEQALVWHYHPEERPQLLDRRELGPDARRLAAGLIYVDKGSKCNSEYRKLFRTAENSDASGKQSQRLQKEYWNKQLAFLDELQQADPENALVYYRKALLLIQSDSEGNAVLKAIRAGNRLHRIRSYIPDVPDNVLDATYSTGDSIIYSYNDVELSKSLFHAMWWAADDQEKKGHPVRTARLMRDSCRMAANYACMEPYSIYSWTPANSGFRGSWSRLKAAHNKLGTHPPEGFARVAAVVDRGSQSVHSDAGFEAFVSHAWSILAFPYLLYIQTAFSLLLLITALLWVAPAYLGRRLHGGEHLKLAPWREGWLARMLTALYVPVLAAVVLSIFALPRLDPDLDARRLIPTAVIIAILPALGMVITALKQLHASDDAREGKHTGFAAFVFLAPSGVKAWTRKYVIAALGAQLILLLCCISLLTIVYRPLAGVEPWRIDRLQFERYSHDKALVAGLARELRQVNLDTDGTKKEGNETVSR